MEVLVFFAMVLGVHFGTMEVADPGYIDRTGEAVQEDIDTAKNAEWVNPFDDFELNWPCKDC